ncbi:MAG: sulfotransferase [Candidatus Omnitrophica bacterium]|nr:sulfotransferase [Candidatus Omnitrophota bacterium]
MVTDEKLKDSALIMEKLLGLPVYILVTTGRTGSDLLQSLLDSHPEVATFNGSLLFHDFWARSVCVKAGEFDSRDFIDEFVGFFIERFKSRYDLFERKNKLGDGRNKSIDIDISCFKEIFVQLLVDRRLDLKTIFVAIYGAYAIVLGQDIESKKIIFHHEHGFDRLDLLMDDFPTSKIICTTRDPRANFVSGILHWRKFDLLKDNEAFLYFYIRRILADVEALERLNHEYCAIKLEDMGNDKVLNGLCQWLGISHNDCLKRSTWAGLTWHGDALSTAKHKDKGWSAKALVNNWEKKLSWHDKSVLNCIMNNRLVFYGYSLKKIGIFDIFLVPFLILLPLSFELRFFSPQYIWNNLKKSKFKVIITNVIWYLLRVKLFFKYYLRVISGKQFLQPVLGKEQL